MVNMYTKSNTNLAFINQYLFVNAE